MTQRFNVKSSRDVVHNYHANISHEKNDISNRSIYVILLFPCNGDRQMAPRMHHKVRLTELRILVHVYKYIT